MRVCFSLGISALTLFAFPLTASASSESALAVLQPTDGNTAKGVITFTHTKDTTTIRAEVSGLSPDGKHGFHIHEFGDCSAPDGTSAGGHFNPENVKHGAPDEDTHHVGDLGNLEADSSGEAVLEITDSEISFSGPNSVVGRAVIVHAKPDIFDQPTGSAGARIACGVIGISDPS